MTNITRRTAIKYILFSTLVGTVRDSYSESLPVGESRAILDEGLHWITKDGAEKVCKRIYDAGFNVFIPCVWYGEGTMWPSTLATWDERVPEHIRNNASLDPLAYLLETAAKYDLEVHPWFTLGKIQDKLLEELGAEDLSSPWYNRVFREFITRLVLEVVEKYPVQGVNLDYVRFMKWARDQEEGERLVASVIREISTKAREYRPSIVVSVDAAPWSPDIIHYGQNALKWAEEGIIDVIYSMQYQPEPDFKKSKELRTTLKRPEAFVVMLGNFDRERDGRVVPRDAHALVNLIEITRKSFPGNGVSAYLYGYLSDDQIRVLRESVFDSRVGTSWNRARIYPPVLTRE